MSVYHWYAVRNEGKTSALEEKLGRAACSRSIDYYRGE